MSHRQPKLAPYVAVGQRAVAIGTRDRGAAGSANAHCADVTIVRDIPDTSTGGSEFARRLFAYVTMTARSTFAALLSVTALSALPGCVWYGPHSMTRAWADHNTLNSPAFYVERLSHAPPPRERVERFRWQYGVGPGVPFAVPDPPVLAPQALEQPDTQPEDFSVPPAPPPEPQPPSAQSLPAQQPVPTPPPYPNDAVLRRPRHNLAWMFTPARW
ncbi:MAG: hypothetical protein M3552_09955 [Planctomycetota bacterium]|nr:hypothetical protein [Planctomycetaceae bacterium]MDQ3330962.1 hypothetical protein [Planctomycetota bacterium]